MSLPWWGVPLLIGVLVLLPGVSAETVIHNLDAGMDVEITYPDEIIAGRDGIISVLIKNNGWEDKQDISFVVSNQDDSLVTGSSDGIIIDRLAQEGSYGGSIDLSIPGDASPGVHFLNIRYSQVLVANNETPQPAVFRDIAIPIVIKEGVDITIHTKTPESIFANAEFPIEVEILSEDVDITDVSIRIIPLGDIEFAGWTQSHISKIEKNAPVVVTSRIITPVEEVNKEYRLPFKIIVEFTDDVGEEREESQIVPVILRPRAFMELTTDGGIWIGGLFIAPYVSIGTIIGIPASVIISLLVRRNKRSGRKYEEKKES